MKLLGKVAIVTGGSGVIGRSVVEELAKEGCNVVFTYLRDKKSSDMMDLKCKSLKGEVYSLKCDVRKREDIEKVVKFTLDKFRKIDILVNNAGIGFVGPFEKTNEKIWDDIISVDLKGPYNFCKSLVPIMRKQNYGKIVNISSIGGVLGHEGNIAHGSAKAGLIGFTRNLAIDLAKYGINVNVIAPGSIRTHLPNEVYEKFTEKIPLGRVGEGKDIAKAVIFLVSSDSDFITGETLVVDGGHSIKIHFT
jgi:3-oxoacyl-[acyl-carrier protein] reductase